MLSLSQVAQELGVSRQAMSGWVQAGRVPAQRVGQVLIVDAADLPAIKAQLASWTGDHGAKADTQLPVITPAELGAYIAIADAAAELGRDVMTLRRWCKVGRVQGYRLGLHKVYLLRADVAAIKGNLTAGRGPFEAGAAGGAAGPGGDRGV